MIKSIHIFLLGTLMLFASCASTPTTHYYLLESSPVTARKPVADGISLALEHVTAELPYSDDRLIYRDSVFEIKFYHYHRWVKPPEMMITDKIVARMQSSGICKNVVKAPSPVLTDYLLKGHIVSLEEWDEGQQWFGRVRLAFSLLDVNSHEIVWQQEFSHQTPIPKHQPVAVVQALNASADQCIADLISALKPILK